MVAVFLKGSHIVACSSNAALARSRVFGSISVSLGTAGLNPK